MSAEKKKCVLQNEYLPNEHRTCSHCKTRQYYVYVPMFYGRVYTIFAIVVYAFLLLCDKEYYIHLFISRELPMSPRKIFYFPNHINVCTNSAALVYYFSRPADFDTIKPRNCLISKYIHKRVL